MKSKRHLDAAGIRERHCVVAIPSNWIMSQHSKVPELSPEDLASLLQLEAEKGFPCDPAQLQIARSISRAEGSSYVTQLAVRKEQLGHLTAVLAAAGLKAGEALHWGSPPCRARFLPRAKAASRWRSSPRVRHCWWRPVAASSRSAPVRQPPAPRPAGTASIAAWWAASCASLLSRCRPNCGPVCSSWICAAKNRSRNRWPKIWPAGPGQPA